MKLRNKKTGEIKEVEPITIGGFRSLAELNEEWEDYKEPKENWFIHDGVGEAMYAEDKNDCFDRAHKKIGNYFDTREEAEKAVEKLKAWKRLKDYDLHIEFANSPEYDEDDDCWYCSVDFSVRAGGDGDKLLDLLFGGEE